MPNKLKLHEAAEIFPSLVGKAYETLRADIKQHGLIHPIVLHENKILDGRNRYNACCDLKIEPRFEQWTPNGQLPVEFVISTNLHRRHLTPTQTAAAGAKAKKEYEKEAKEAQKAGGKTGGQISKRSSSGQKKKVVPKKAAKKKSVPKKAEKKKPKDIGTKRVKKKIRLLSNDNNLIDNKAAAKAAEKVGSSYAQVQRADKIRREAPDLFKRMECDEITLAQAGRELARRQKQKEQKKQARAAKKRAQERTKSDPAGSLWKIIHGDCIEQMEKLDRGSVRLCFADPPYNIGIDYGKGKKADLLPAKEYLDWCRRWMLAVHPRLTPDGSFWVMICDEWADHFGVMLSETGFHRRAWIKWYESFGTNRSGNFNRCSRHIFYCVKDPNNFVFNADAVNRPSDRQTKYNDKRADSWGKIWDDVWQISRLVGNAKERIPEFPTQIPLELLRPIIGCASNPDDLILDPFSGSASTGAASIELHRRYIGIEKSKKFCKLSEERMWAETNK